MPFEHGPINLKERGRELLEDEGFTPYRAFRKLKKEFPNAETFDLWVAVGKGPTGVMPFWADRSGSGRSVTIRNDPRRFTDK